MRTIFSICSIHGYLNYLISLYQDIVEELLKYGHNVYETTGIMSVLQVIHRHDIAGTLVGVSDERKISGRPRYVTEDVLVLA